MYGYGTQTHGPRSVPARARCDRHASSPAAARSACRRPRATSIARSRCWRKTSCSRGSTRRRSTSSSGARSTSSQTELNSTHSIAVQQAAQKLLPFNDPELRQPDDGRNARPLARRGQGVLRENDAPRSRDDRRRRQRDRGAGARVDRARRSAAGTPTGPPPAVDLPPVPLNRPGDVKIPLPSIHQDYVTLEQLVPLPRSSPQYYPLVLGNAVLGGGSLGPEQSRLFRDIRQNAGLVYSIDSQFVSGGTRSRFSIEFACARRQRGRIESMVNDELAQLRKEPIGDFELGLMKASMVRRVVLGAAVGEGYRPSPARTTRRTAYRSTNRISTRSTCWPPTRTRSKPPSPPTSTPKTSSARSKGRNVTSYRIRALAAVLAGVAFWPHGCRPVLPSTWRSERRRARSWSSSISNMRPSPRGISSSTSMPAPTTTTRPSIAPSTPKTRSAGRASRLSKAASS